MLLILLPFLCLQLDSSSYFHDLAPGVENDGTGIIVALAAAKALGAAKRNVSPQINFYLGNKLIMFRNAFTFFNPKLLSLLR